MSVICRALRSITSNARSLRSSAAAPLAMDSVSARSETAPKQRRLVVCIVTPLSLIEQPPSPGGTEDDFARHVPSPGLVINILDLADQFRRCGIDGADDLLGL